MKNKYVFKTACSRFFFAPINTGFNNGNTPSNRLIKFHKERSGKGIGVSYVGNVAIDTGFKTNENTLTIMSNQTKWHELASVISKNNSIPGIQLGCKLPQLESTRKWIAPKGEGQLNTYRQFITNLKPSDIDFIFSKFISATTLAMDYGFKVVQIHAAHGYFLSLLMNKSINKRTDKYSYKNTGSIPELLNTLKNTSDNITLDIRISCIDGLTSEEVEWHNRKRQLSEFESAGADIISLSAGLYDFSRKLIYPNKTVDKNVYLKFAEDFAKDSNIIINVAGNLWDLEDLDSTYSNITFGIGRALIADPYFIEKYMSGHIDDINNCVHGGHCHYFTRGKDSLSCKVNSNI